MTSSRRGRPPVNQVDGSDFEPERVKPMPAPRHLTAAEGKVWTEVCRHNQHVNHPAFTHLVEAFARAVVRARVAAAILEAEGLVVETRDSVKQHPALAALQGAESTIASLSSKIAVSAPSRREVGKPAHAPKPSQPKGGKAAGDKPFDLRLA